MGEEGVLQRVYLEGRCNQQKTYDNQTGEHTSGQEPIFIQDWQTHWSTKNMELMNGSEASGHVHRLVKGEQNERDSGRVIEHNHKLKET